MRLKRLQYEDGILVLVLAGAVLGTILVNLSYDGVKDQAGYFIELMDRNQNIKGEEQRLLFFWVLRQRLAEAVFAWLVGLTVFAVPCFCVLAAGWGMSVGMILSVATCQKGIWGLSFYLMTLFPHYLVYIPIWMILAMWAGRKRRRRQALAFLILLLLLTAGAAAETFLNPWFLKMAI